MSQSVPDVPARYAAFLAALRRTANAELSFKQSGVNRSWAYWRRKRDAVFARDWMTALVDGRAVLKTRDRPVPWDAGKPLILTGGRRVAPFRLRRPGWQDFTADRKALFLATLRATCNVTHAARAVEIVPSTARRHRRNDTAFAAAWDKALADGHAALECAALGIMPANEPLPMPGITRQAALHVFRELMMQVEER